MLRPVSADKNWRSVRVKRITPRCSGCMVRPNRRRCVVALEQLERFDAFALWDYFDRQAALAALVKRREARRLTVQWSVEPFLMAARQRSDAAGQHARRPTLVAENLGGHQSSLRDSNRARREPRLNLV